MAVRKDYKAIAGIIKHEYYRFNNTGENDHEGQHAVICIAQSISDYFASQNEFFNREAFLDTCGIAD